MSRRFQILDLFRLKPFDEGRDDATAYATSGLLAIAVLASSGLSLISLLLAILSSPRAMPTLGLAIAVSAITAGIEWSVGLRGRALNQLFSIIVVTACFWLLNTALRTVT